MKNYHKGGSQTLFYEPSAVRKRAVKGGQVSSSLTFILVMFPMTRVMFPMTWVLMEMMVMLMIVVQMLTMTMVRLMEIMVRMTEMMVISRRASSSFSSPPLP